MNEEILFVGTAESEHVEMYLKTIWMIKESNEQVKVTKIAKKLNIRGASVIQMLRKLKEQNLVIYDKFTIDLTDKGKRIASEMVRNSRLLEVLMSDSLKVNVDDEIVCGIEHHMNIQFANALCTMLNHPRKCPHDNNIPQGNCCINL
jgi:DtxR family Mn-dependent transcriptional regulator